MNIDGMEVDDQMPDVSFPDSAVKTTGSYWPQGLPSVGDIFSTLGSAALVRAADKIAGNNPASPTSGKGAEGRFGKLGTVGVSIGMDDTVKTVLIVVAIAAGIYFLPKLLK